MPVHFIILLLAGLFLNKSCEKATKILGASPASRLIQNTFLLFYYPFPAPFNSKSISINYFADCKFWHFLLKKILDNLTVIDYNRLG